DDELLGAQILNKLAGGGFHLAALACVPAVNRFDDVADGCAIFDHRPDLSGASEQAIIIALLKIDDDISPSIVSCATLDSLMVSRSHGLMDGSSDATVSKTCLSLHPKSPLATRRPPVPSSFRIERWALGCIEQVSAMVKG